jgi:hypothetical protein
MTATASSADIRTAPEVVRKLVHWFESGEVLDGLFTPDVFADLTVPQWRLQATGPEAAAALRRHSHPAPGVVPRLRYDPTPTGFVLEWEEEWDEHGEHWYCREMMRADVTDGSIAELSVYCTGDWDSARVARHAREVVLTRP